jgi:hypothetical protein
MWSLHYQSDIVNGKAIAESHAQDDSWLWLLLGATKGRSLLWVQVEWKFGD